MKRIKQLFEQYNQAIFRYFLRMLGNREEAEELVQETFYQACLSLYRFRHESSLKTWFFSIARNVYLKHLRGKNNHKTYSWEENLLLKQQNIQDSDPPAEMLILEEKRKRIKEALLQLPENARTIIIMKEYEELSYEEIAGIFDQTVNWTRVNFFRAKRQLAQKYRELEGDNR